MGRFQLEAAIQSVHAQRAITGQVDWEVLALLYAGLVQLSPTVGALVNQASAIAEAQGLNQSLVQLDALPIESVKNYQPFWALKAHLLKQLGYKSEAKQAYSQAIGLTEDAAIREFLLHQSLSLDE